MQLQILLSLSTLLLSGVPGIFNEVPGIGKQYLPEQASITAAILFKEMWLQSLKLLPFVLIASFGVVQISKKVSLGDALKHIAWVAILYCSIPLVFWAVFSGGAIIAAPILQGKDMQKLNEEIRDAAIRAQNDRGIDNNEVSENKGWIPFLAKYINRAGTSLTADIFMSVITLVYFIVQQVIYLLWRALVIALYAFSPPIVLMGAIPIWGNQILSKWFGSVIQLSLWQPWLAICSFFVLAGDSLFVMTLTYNGQNSISNHLESVAIAGLMTALIIYTPKATGKFIPSGGFGGLIDKAPMPSVPGV